MDEETKKCVCADDCTCKCDDVGCGCCEKKDSGADIDPEAEPAEETEEVL